MAGKQSKSNPIWQASLFDPGKCCSGCKRSLPFTYFAFKSKERGKLQSECIDCCKLRKRAYYLANSEVLRAKIKARVAAHPERKREQDHLYRLKHQDRLNKHRREYQLANMGRHLEISAAWRKANIDKARANEQAYRDRNREICNARIREWKAKNPEALTAAFHKRRSQELRAIPEWADLDQIAAVYKAAQRFKDEGGKTFHVDHVVPLISPLVCGLHVWANLQVLSPKVNLKKNNRTWPDMP